MLITALEENDLVSFGSARWILVVEKEVSIDDQDYKSISQCLNRPLSEHWRRRHSGLHLSLAA
jgi:hypothetical protein